MVRNIGFACMSKVINTKYKTFRLSNFTTDKFHECVSHNIRETEKLIDYCIANGYKIIRLSSDIIPFASHDVATNIDWMQKYHVDFKHIGNKIKQNNMRVSLHPGQYSSNINSPDKNVVIHSFKELIYHSNILNLLGVDGDIVTHVGGVYGDKNTAMKRFITMYNKLPERVKNRLVLENDDKSYTIHDVIKIHKYTNIPIVFDYHHHICNYIKLDVDVNKIFDTWGDRVPKVHLSSPKNEKQFRSHADDIDIEYCINFLNEISKLSQ
jgi:UV DNA damage endonuclease